MLTMLNVVGLALSALPGLWALRRKKSENCATEDGVGEPGGRGNDHPSPAQAVAAPKGLTPELLRHLATAGAQCAVGVAVLYLAQTAASAITNPRRRGLSPSGDATPATPKWIASKAGGIPLAEVVRFRERQWFKDELEAAKQGDTGSMVRLAKLHLAGAGCAKDLDAAKYWVRRARKLGAWVSLEELIMDGPDPPPFKPPPGFLASAARTHAPA